MKIESKYIKLELVGDKFKATYKLGRHIYKYTIDKNEDIEKLQIFLNSFKNDYGINFYHGTENDTIIIEYEKNDISDYIEIDVIN